jgi:hypothetical protein
VATPAQTGSTRRWATLLGVFLLVLAMMAVTGSATAAVDEGGAESAAESSEPEAGAEGGEPAATDGPSVWTSKDDYVPEELVDLHGSGWAPGEEIALHVDDHGGKSWEYPSTVTADDQGNFYYEFRLPAWYVPAYTVTATGESSGVAEWQFDDSIAEGPIVSTVNGGTGELTLNMQAIAAGQVAIAQVVVNKDLKEGSICPPTGWTSILRTNRSSGVYVQETFRRTGPVAAGSHTWTFRTGLCPSSGSVTAKGAAGGAVIYSGVDTTNPIRSSADDHGASSGPFTAPTSPATAGDQVLRLFGFEKNTTVSHATNPALWIERSSGGPSERTAAAFAHAHSSGTTTGAFTVTTGTSAEWTAQTVVLRMAPAPTCTAASVTTHPSNESIT